MESVVHGMNVCEEYVRILTPFEFSYLNDQFANLASTVGLPADQVKYVGCLFAIYPFAFLFRYIPNRTLKHVYSFGLGLFVAHFVLGTGWIHSFITSLVSYVCMKYGPKKYAPYIVFIFNMTYLSIAHLYRIYNAYMEWNLDFTGPQMLFIIRLTSFAYNLYDGEQLKEKDIAEIKDPRERKLVESRKKYALDHMPSLLEYYGYLYCFATFLAGPAFELREYLDVIDGSKFAFKGKARMQPSSVLSAFMKLGVGLIFMGAYVGLSPLFPLPNFFDDKVAALPLFKHIGVLWITMFALRSKYYFGWKVAEGASVLCGFGFEGYHEDGSTKGWNNVSNIDIITFETVTNVRDAARAWNKGTQAWLERYVYSRTGNSLFMTYFCSAFWHGFYPGYYIFFMSVPLATAVNRLAYKRLRPWFKTSKGLSMIYELLCWICSSLLVNYLAIPFQALSWEFSIKALTNVYWFGHVALVVLYLLYSVLPTPKSHAKKTLS